MDQREDEQEQRWVAGLRQGDEEALGGVMAHYRQRLLRLVQRYVRDPETAMDVLQDVFLNLYRNMGRLEEDTRLFPLLARMASNRAIDYLRRERHLRKQASLTELEEINHVPSVPGDQMRSLQAGERSRLLAAAIERLPPKQKEIFFLRHHEGMKLEEIAREQGVALGTVKATLNQAVKNLRKSVEADTRRP